MKRILTLIAGLLLITACRLVVTPKGEPEERAKAKGEQPAFERKLGERILPDLTVSATLPATLEYAFKASGEIEAAYFDWRAAIERVPQAGALPDPKLEFESLFSGGGGKGFNLDVASLGLSQDIPGAGKREARAEVALREAQGAGERFRAAKFSLQRRVVGAYAQWALNEDMIRLTSDTLRLLKETYNVALHRYHEMADTGLADMRKIELEIQTAESSQRGLGAARPALAADINGLLNRKADAPLADPRLPEITLPTSPTTELFALAVARNADLAALRKDVATRGAAETLAQLERRPDYSVGGKAGYQLNPTAYMPSLTLGMTLPINRARIRAAIAESLAARQAAEARYRAAESDTLARLVTALVLARDASRVIHEYQTDIIPKARELYDIQIRAYGQGNGDLLSNLDTERTIVELRKAPLQAEADRLRFLAEIEEIMAEDLFRFKTIASDAK